MSSLITAFVLGYVLAWGAFSLAAAAGQWSLERGELLSSMGMAFKNDVAAGGVLIIAGLYQWTPLKHACLKRCRTPIGFLMTEWRDGFSGAVIMGWRHGVFCVGCCWALMALLFVAGVMNALWIIGLTLFVIVEKLAPKGDLIARTAGLGLVLSGTWLVLSLIGVTTSAIKIRSKVGAVSSQREDVLSKGPASAKSLCRRWPGADALSKA